MRPGTLLFLASLLLLSHTALAQSPSPKLRITADCYKEGDWLDDKGEKFQDWAYKVTLQNTSGSDLTDLEIRYRVFLHDQVNADGSPDSPLSFNDYKSTLQDLKPIVAKSSKTPPPPSDPTLKRSETRIVSTSPMAVGAGKAVRADRDIFKGIWIRVFAKSGEEVGSLVKPASLAKSMPWK